MGFWVHKSHIEAPVDFWLEYVTGVLSWWSACECLIVSSCGLLSQICPSSDKLCCKNMCIWVLSASVCPQWVFCISHFCLKLSSSVQFQCTALHILHSFLAVLCHKLAQYTIGKVCDELAWENTWSDIAWWDVCSAYRSALRSWQHCWMEFLPLLHLISTMQRWLVP